MNIELQKTQLYLNWLKEKLYLNCIAPNTKNKPVYRGEVYRCKFGFGVGCEQSKERPCLILQYNPANLTSPNTIVAPITHTSSNVPVVFPLKPKTDLSNNIILDGNVLLGNITCVSKARLGAFITKLSKDEMIAIDEIIAKSLGILHHYNTLQSKHSDQLQYLQKVKEKNAVLQKEIASLQQTVSSLRELIPESKNNC